MALAPRVVHREAPFGEPLETLRVRRAPRPVRDLVDDRPQPAGRDLPAVELADRAGGDVTRVGVERFAGNLTLAVDALELGPRHVDLATHQEPRWSPRRKAQRQRAHRPQIVGDVVADRTVAARRAAHEQAVLVEQRGGDPVDLELGDELETGGRFVWGQPFEPSTPFAQLVEVIGIVERHHRRLVAHRREAGERLSADTPGRAVGRRELRPLPLERHELAHQPVELAIPDLRPAEGVIEPLVALDLAAQLRGAARRVASQARGSGCGHRPRRPGRRHGRNCRRKRCR